MKDNYDFSGGQRGKFYNENARYHVPVYLDEGVMDFVESQANKEKTDISTMVNTLLARQMEHTETGTR